MTTVVAFDLDGTLLKGNSSYAMSHFLYQRGVLSFSDMVFCVRTYLRSFVKPQTLAELHSTIFQHLLKGKDFGQFIDHIDDFVSMRISKMLYLPALRELQRWKESKARLVLLSASPDPLVKRIAKVLGLAEGYGTEYSVDNQGKLLCLKKLLDGQYKADFVKAETKRFMTTQSIAYSDHIYDLPLLETVKHPIVVKPERRLKKLARKRGWKIL